MTDTHEHDHPHVMPLWVLFGVFALLMVFTVLTVAATWIDLGSLNIVLALAIAFVKAIFVCLYFMHLRYDHPFNGFVLIASLLFVVLFIGIAMLDSKGYRPNIEAATPVMKP